MTDIKRFDSFFKESAVHQAGVSDGISMKQWSMERDHTVCYLNNNYHTLSLYTKGGNNNVRTDRPDLKGLTDTFCFMPQEQESNWHISQRVEFTHLYFNSTIVHRFAAHTYQMDTRCIELSDQVFKEDDQLKSLFKHCLMSRSLNDVSPLFFEESVYELLHHVIRSFNVFDVKHIILKGGLSPLHMETVYDQISDELGTKLTIDGLARTVHLSPYHFAKMFKISFGESPARFINWMRIERVKRLLKTKLSLTGISLQAGFNHQSHMTQSFKTHTGITPARYRRLIRN
ncbi:MAG: AraC family transcriptional regulator [Bacteroidota bacterium]